MNNIPQIRKAVSEFSTLREQAEEFRIDSMSEVPTPNMAEKSILGKRKHPETRDSLGLPLIAKRFREGGEGSKLGENVRFFASHK